jgi:molybdopterin-guanine dinucleotide biosynthesis protein A
MRAEGFVLAGGQSSRMGRDKALVELAGRPLIAWALDVLRGAGLTAKIAGAKTDLSVFAPVAPDAWDNVGPLGGVCSALRQTELDWAVFVTVDQPLMSPALLVGLLEHARSTEQAVTVASVSGVPQTFPAVVRRTALNVLEGELDQGRLGCMVAFRVAGRKVVAAEEIAGPEARVPVDAWFANVNTPQDFERVKSLLTAG